MPTSRGSRSARATISSAKTEVHEGRLACSSGSPVSGSIWPDGVELVGDVGDGRLVAATLLGDDVHDDRRVVVLGLAQRLLERPRSCPWTGPMYLMSRFE